MYISYSNKTKRILDELRHNACTAREIFESLLPHSPDTFKVTKRLLGYMEAPKKPSYKMLKRLEEKRFYTLLSKLRKEGLVKKRGSGADAIWQLTGNGFKKLIRYTTQQKQHPILPKRNYIKKKISEKMLVTFDVPESLKHYRNWIRCQLTEFGFTMLQKSVWIGTYAVPADFIHDLRDFNLLQYIHIFKVTKSGSIIS